MANKKGRGKRHGAGGAPPGRGNSGWSATPTPPPGPWAKLTDFLGSTVGMLAALVTVASGAIAITVLWPLEPEIRPPIGRLSSPIVGRFTIANRSWLFDYHKVHVECIIVRANFGDITFERARISRDGTGEGEVGARKTRIYQCSIGGFERSTPSEMVIELIVNYQTLGFARSPVKETFTWDPKTGLWGDGEGLK